MINTKDYRIGNLVEILGEVREITGVIRYGLYFEGGYCPNKEDWIKQIPITENWLRKADFEKIYESDFQVKYELIINRHSLTISFHNDTSINCYLNNSLLKEFTFHQLQNIYYDLQGEELKINKDEATKS